MSKIIFFMYFPVLLTISEYFKSRKKGKSTLHDFTLAAQACIPIINSVLLEIKNQSYPQICFLNVVFPTNVANNKVCQNLMSGQFWCTFHVYYVQNYEIGMASLPCLQDAPTNTVWCFWYSLTFLESIIILGLWLQIGLQTH